MQTRRKMCRFGRLSAAIVLGICTLGPLTARADETPEASQPPTKATTKEVPSAGAPPEASVEDLGKPRTADDVALRGLQEQVNGLKEKVFRSKARLLLLRETVLSGSMSGAKARVTHKNQLGSTYTLEKVAYALDGQPLLTRAATDGSLNTREDLEVFVGSVVPGNHSLSVQMVYRGSGYGVFEYMDGYTFEIKSSYPFVAEEGQVTSIDVTVFEDGGITTDVKDRPNLRYDVRVEQDKPELPKSESETPKDSNAP
jgi:hypothetical protein